jgi:hypothetical protein
MTTPPGPEGMPWQGAGPSAEFMASFQAEMARLAAQRGVGQPDPLSPMAASFVVAHTLFEAAVRSGFTERQAIMAAIEILLRS